jgi:bile acid:Na+ symporter, BASS family
MTRIFLPLALIASGLALWQPEWFARTRPAIPWLLGVIMFGMGMTLKPADFSGVLKRWKFVGIGLCAQYTIMPLLALLIAMALNLPKEVVAGFVLLGACPGGTASNVVTYLARGNVALSVSMTLASTLVSPVLTPWVTWLLASQKVEIQAFAMMRTILVLVAVPLGAGLLARTFAGGFVQRILKALPLLSMLAICWVIAIVMALNQERILAFPIAILAGVILHNICGMTLGYGTGRIFTKDLADCRTLAIEIGMQNSGLAVALASKYLAAAAALPAALFSLWHNLSGAAFASWVGRKSSDPGG